MAVGLSPQLRELLQSDAGASRDAAWTSFLESYSEPILGSARALGGDEDDVSDRYLYVLEELHRDDLKRLRAYTPDSRARFTTWLSIVVRRLCVDHHRKKYGRDTGDESARTAASERRQLVDLVGAALDVEELPMAGDNPHARVERLEDREALASAVSALEPRDRLLLSLRFEEDLTAKEIARFLRFQSVFHVYRRINKTLDRLRDTLEARGIEP